MATINDETYIIWGDEENGYEINEMKTKNYLKEFSKLLSSDLSKREIQELLTDVEEGLQTDGMFYFNFSNEQGYDSFAGVCLKKKYPQLKQMLKDMRDEFMSSLDESCGNNLSKKFRVMKNLSEANKYFFGTKNRKDVKRLFESQSDKNDQIVSLKDLSNIKKYYDTAVNNTCNILNKLIRKYTEYPVELVNMILDDDYGDGNGNPERFVFHKYLEQLDKAPINLVRILFGEFDEYVEDLWYNIGDYEYPPKLKTILDDLQETFDIEMEMREEEAEM